MKVVLIALFTGLCYILNAQQFSGTATYSSNTKVDITFDTTQIPPERLKMMKQMMRQQLQKEYTLKFNRTASLFEEVEQLEQEGMMRGAGMMVMMAGGAGSKVYKRLADKQSFEQLEFFGKVFLIHDSLEDFNWKLGKETKQIGSYTCYKATTTRQIITRTVSSEADEKSVDDTLQIEVTAWYTPQIPLNHGPDIYWGLPGLILEVNTDKTTILCTKIELKQEDKAIDQPTKGEEVTRGEFREIMEAKMAEMEKMRNGREQRGPRGSFQIRMSR